LKKIVQKIVYKTLIMKRLLLSILMIISTFAVSAQCADSITVIFENFNGTTTGWSYSSNHTDLPATDWSLNTTLYASPPSSINSPIYVNVSTVGNCLLAVDTIRKIPGKTKYYLSFKHICKVHQLDEARIQIRNSTGGDATNGYTFPQWTSVPVSFTHTSPNYYGDANTTDAILGGKFSHNTYPTLWQSSNNNAVPTMW
jgi:hypothetical protein